MNLEDSLLEILGDAPISIRPPETGVGIRASIPIDTQSDERSFYMELFVECTFPESPKDSDLGYTREDAQRFDGVQVLSLDDEDGPSGVIKYNGEIVSMSEFEQKLENPALKIQFDRTREQLQQTLDQNQDEYLEQINELWINRWPGENLVTERNWC